MDPGQILIDESGGRHLVTQCIGRGGQGEAWLTKGGRRIVKLFARARDAEAVRRQLTFVKRLDLSGLHVARPLAILKPPLVGYVAEFLDDMAPLKSLLEAPASGLLRWHLDGGGLRRRLRLLAHAGEALRGLHGQGVVYADVSHHNVFVSRPAGEVEAWLIDLDNLTHESDPSRAIHTPGYGAPEVVAGASGCTTLSDAWSFAVLTWQTLTLTHPFVGDLVNDGDPDLEVKAFAGELPWTGHSTDRSNACAAGLPPEHVLATRLMELARKTFEDGLRDPKRRPGVSAWVERLHTAADLTVACAGTGCSGTYFVTEPSCPWCGDPLPPIEVVQFQRWAPDQGLVEGLDRLPHLPLTAEGLRLSARLTQARSGLEGRAVHVELRRVEKGIKVQARPGFEAWVAPVGRALEERHPVTERGRVVPARGWMVLFEDPHQPQRVAVLGRRP
ncbi:MAG TPA: serine/threonine-protein kinase [Myxococcaceae bacterium]|nr:serine/threonine-protein kinase [Myxococcaceae bacterium]